VTTSADVAIVGGGIIGLSCAWRLRQHGRSVAVVDPTPGAGASHVAAGMLAPVTEVHYGEQSLLALNLASAARWPDFAAELEHVTGQCIGYRRDGTLAVAADDDELRVLDTVRQFQESLCLRVTRLGRRACREREPALSPRVRGGVLAEDDHQVDPRSTVEALLLACERAGVRFERARAAEVAGGMVETTDGPIACGVVVHAAGCWSGSPVRPVKGQILRLRFDPAAPPLIATVRGVDVYLVPRATGELVVGATVEEQGFDTAATAGAVYGLLHAGMRLVPGISELPIVEAGAGLRPGTPDNAPLLGPTDVEGVVAATGHYRNGVLLAPITAEIVAELVDTGVVPALARPFDARRFVACR